MSMMKAFAERVSEEMGLGGELTDAVLVESQRRIDAEACIPEFAIGDKIAYAANFLRSIGAVTGPMAFARGTIRAIVPFGKQSVAIVDWDKNTRYDAPRRILTTNLCKIGSRRFSAD